MLCFKFHRNRPINEEFDFWGGLIISGGLEGGRETRFQKILIQNGGLNPHQKFQHSNSIRKCSKNRGAKPSFGGCFRPPNRGGGGEGSDYKTEKMVHGDRWEERVSQILSQSDDAKGVKNRENPKVKRSGKKILDLDAKNGNSVTRIHSNTL